MRPRVAAVPAFFPPLQRVAIDRVACPAPDAYGLQVSRWEWRALPQVVVEHALVEPSHSTTVAPMLAHASLPPHRSRYWKTARLDEAFLRLAAKVLGGSESVDWRQRRGEVVIGREETPSLQALRRVAPPPRGARDAENGASSSMNARALSISWWPSTSMRGRCGGGAGQKRPRPLLGGWAPSRTALCQSAAHSPH